MIYNDILEYNGISPDNNFYVERKMIKDIGAVYHPNETQSFKENLHNFYIHRETRHALEQILEIKTKLYLETGVVI